MRFLAIGDIHGSADQLSRLLSFTELREERHTVFLGDFVDVGPDSKEVIELLIAFQKACASATFLLGNHDLALRQYIDSGLFASYAAIGGIATIRSYCGEVHGDVHQSLIRSIPPEHINFLERLDLYLEDKDFLFSHAGCDPKRPHDRSMECMVSGSFSGLFEGPSLLSQTIVCGHYFQQTFLPFVSRGFICLDTGCAVLNGPLTACLIPEYTILQVWPDLSVSKLELR